MEYRRAYYMAALAYHFGVRPWEIDLLTVDEFDHLCAAVDQIAEEASRG